MLEEVTVTPADAAVGNKEQEACKIISVDKNRIGRHGACKILRAVSYLQETAECLRRYMWDHKKRRFADFL